MRSPVFAYVPLRSPGAGKTRLAPHLSPTDRAALAGAMLADVCDALVSSPVDRVTVVASGPTAAAAAAALDVEVVIDPPASRGLNDALAAAVADLPTDAASLVVTADLPGLRPMDVTALLETDADVVIAETRDGGTGGLLRRPPARALPPTYGHGSAARHLGAAKASGLTVTALSLPGFEHDVDTWDDIAALREREVGRHTAAVVERLRSRRLSSRPRTPAPGGDPMPQGTVKSFNPDTSTAVLLDDTLAERPVDREAFVASGLMELRVGQRVRFELEDTAQGERVTQLNIVSL